MQILTKTGFIVEESKVRGENSRAGVTSREGKKVACGTWQKLNGGYGRALRTKKQRHGLAKIG